MHIIANVRLTDGTFVTFYTVIFSLFEFLSSNKHQETLLHDWKLVSISTLEFAKLHPEYNRNNVHITVLVINARQVLAIFRQSGKYGSLYYAVLFYFTPSGRLNCPLCLNLNMVFNMFYSASWWQNRGWVWFKRVTRSAWAKCRSSSWPEQHP